MCVCAGNGEMVYPEPVKKIPRKASKDVGVTYGVNRSSTHSVRRLRPAATGSVYCPACPDCSGAMGPAMGPLLPAKTHSTNPPASAAFFGDRLFRFRFCVLFWETSSWCVCLRAHACVWGGPRKPQNNMQKQKRKKNVTLVSLCSGQDEFQLLYDMHKKSLLWSSSGHKRGSKIKWFSSSQTSLSVTIRVSWLCWNCCCCCCCWFSGYCWELLPSGFGSTGA